MDDLEAITERAAQARQIMLGTPDTLDATVVFAALADVHSLLDELRRVKEELATEREGRAMANKTAIDAQNIVAAERDRLREENERLREGRWTEAERKLFLFEATKASYAEGVRAGCEELSIHAADMDVEIARLREIEKAAEDAKHFLLQIRQEGLGPLFGAANYKHRADVLYDALRNALQPQIEKDEAKHVGDAAWNCPACRAYVAQTEKED